MTMTDRILDYLLVTMHAWRKRRQLERRLRRDPWFRAAYMMTREVERVFR